MYFLLDKIYNKEANASSFLVALLLFIEKLCAERKGIKTYNVMPTKTKCFFLDRHAAAATATTTTKGISSQSSAINKNERITRRRLKLLIAFY